EALRHRPRHRRRAAVGELQDAKRAGGPPRALRDHHPAHRQLHADARVPEARARRDPGALARPGDAQAREPARRDAARGAAPHAPYGEAMKPITKKVLALSVVVSALASVVAG